MKISQKIFQVKAWFKYRLLAKNKHGLHSPFVYRWYSNIADTQKEYYAFNALRDLRNDLTRQNQKVNIVDFGAGSSISNQRIKKVSSILSHSVKSELAAQRLFKMVDMAQPKTTLELGTSLGITTLYLAMAKREAIVYTLEGSPEIFALAQHHRNSLGINNIEGIEGPFMKTLPPLLQRVDSLDFVFLDGHHQKQATMDYWTMIHPKLSSKAVVVIDDIHWSIGMQEAWEEIKNSPKVRVSIDLYDMGVVFLDVELNSQHFILSV